jgi:hypothetical protein
MMLAQIYRSRLRAPATALGHSSHQQCAQLWLLRLLALHLVQRRLRAALRADGPS